MSRVSTALIFASPTEAKNLPYRAVLDSGGVVSLKFIYLVFPATPTEVLVQEMIETLLAGCGAQRKTVSL